MQIVYLFYKRKKKKRLIMTFYLTFILTLVRERLYKRYIIIIFNIYYLTLA